jgi:hypothetical protein
MKNSIVKLAGLHALGTALYIVGVASFLFYVPRALAGDAEETFLIPTAMLLLFVLSATVTGLLVLGRPVLWYLDGKKKEAVSLFLYTVGFLLLLTVLAFSSLILFSR